MADRLGSSWDTAKDRVAQLLMTSHTRYDPAQMSQLDRTILRAAAEESVLVANLDKFVTMGWVNNARRTNFILAAKRLERDLGVWVTPNKTRWK